MLSDIKKYSSLIFQSRREGRGGNEEKKGKRDLGTQLTGGNGDGDLFNTHFGPETKGGAEKTDVGKTRGPNSTFKPKQGELKCGYPARNDFLRH